MEAATGQYLCSDRPHDGGQTTSHRPIRKPAFSAQLPGRFRRPGRLSQPVLSGLELCRSVPRLRRARGRRYCAGCHMMRRLQWGCGAITPYGWVNSDIQPGPGVDIVADIRAGLPLADGSFDYIVSIHTLPEIPYCDLDRALSELHRVLRPGGVLSLSLPDLDKAIRAYLDKDIDYFRISYYVIRSIAGKMIVQLSWYGRSRCLFTVDSTAELLARNGYRSIQPCPFRQTGSPFPGITE